VQDVANKVAISNGSVSKGEAVVERCGFKLKKKGEKPSRAFEVVESGPGWIHLRVKSVGIKAGYLWRFGITSEKNKAPGVFLPILFTLECDIIITNLTSGVLYGYQVASILPVSRTPETDPALTTVTKKSSVMLSTKSKKASFTVGVDPYNWSDIMYVGSM